VQIYSNMTSVPPWCTQLSYDNLRHCDRFR